MNRRKFLTWIGLGWLASAMPIVVGSAIAKAKAWKESVRQPLGSDGIVFYVDPSGSDAWSGKRETPNLWNTDGPLASLERARDLIRQLKSDRGGTIEQSVTVFLRNGTYYLDEPLVFAPEDSGTADFPIAYRAYPGEKPVISGGRLIKGWRRLRGDIWVAKLPDVKAGKWDFRLLRVGDAVKISG